MGQGILFYISSHNENSPPKDIDSPWNVEEAYTHAANVSVNYIVPGT